MYHDFLGQILGAVRSCRSFIKVEHVKEFILVFHILVLYATIIMQLTYDSNNFFSWLKHEVIK